LSASGAPGEVWAIVVAAGAGERLAADRPKAFVRLGGRTMLAWSLSMLDDHELIDGIVMVVPEEYEERASLLADDLCAMKIAAAVPGGATRPASVAAGLACVPESAAYVLVHDAARPLVPPAVVDRVVAALRGGADGVVPALPVADTVKRVGPDGSVAETLDRAAQRAVQTPQGFPLATLREALAGDHAGATDCASMVERLGRAVVCVEGDERAFKVTTPADLDRAVRLARHDDDVPGDDGDDGDHNHDHGGRGAA
jgi:2-C-methyl-D-erythritol 4-phosphate cytidylyltransferase